MEISKEQFEDIRNFTRSLTAKRIQMADGALLDLCQQHLDALVAHLAEEFEEHPHEEDPDFREVGEPPPPPKPIGHSGQGPKLESSIDPPFTPPPPKPEPPPPSPVPSEPEHEVRHHVSVHKMPHKRPPPRKTHR